MRTIKHAAIRSFLSQHQPRTAREGTEMTEPHQHTLMSANKGASDALPFLRLLLAHPTQAQIRQFSDIRDEFRSDAESCERMLIAAATASPLPDLVTLVQDRLENSQMQATIILADPYHRTFASTHPDPVSAAISLRKVLSGLQALTMAFPERLHVFKAQFPIFQSVYAFGARVYAFLHQYMQRSVDSPVLCATSEHVSEFISSSHAMLQGPLCVPVKADTPERSDWAAFVDGHQEELRQRYGDDATLIFHRDTREVRGVGSTADIAFDNIKGNTDFPMVIANLSNYR